MMMTWSQTKTFYNYIHKHIYKEMRKPCCLGDRLTRLHLRCAFLRIHPYLRPRRQSLTCTKHRGSLVSSLSRVCCSHLVWECHPSQPLSATRKIRLVSWTSRITQSWSQTPSTLISRVSLLPRQGGRVHGDEAAFPWSGWSVGAVVLTKVATRACTL